MTPSMSAILSKRVRFGFEEITRAVVKSITWDIASIRSTRMAVVIVVMQLDYT